MVLKIQSQTSSNSKNQFSQLANSLKERDKNKKRTEVIASQFFFRTFARFLMSSPKWENLILISFR